MSLIVSIINYFTRCISPNEENERQPVPTTERHADSETSSFASYDPRLFQFKILHYVRGILAWSHNRLIVYEDRIDWEEPSGRPSLVVADILIDSIKIGPEDNADTPFMSRNLKFGPYHMNLKMISFVVAPGNQPLSLIFSTIRDLIHFIEFLRKTRKITGEFFASELSRAHYHKLLEMTQHELAEEN